MKMFDVEMKHDKGTFVIRTSASNAETAKVIVCQHENAPLRSAISVTEV